MTPLAGAVRREGRAGAERAYAESDVWMPSMLTRQSPAANGYEYFVDEWLPPSERAKFEADVRRLARAHGGALAVWTHHALPRVVEACAWLESAPVGTTFGALAERLAYVWSHTAVAGVVARGDLNALASACEPVHGERSTFVAYVLAQGSDNETIAADDALWRVAHADAGSPDSHEARERFLAGFGSRATSWSIDHPTLRERPDLVDAQLRLLRMHADRDVEAVRSDAVARRRALAAGIVARLASVADRARFERRLTRVESFVPIREARARWQLVATGALRGGVRARGRLLVERGVIDAVDDVFFLTPEEYDEPPVDVRDAVVARRADHLRWTQVTPPVVIGDPAGEPGRTTDGVLRGTPGAPGATRGRARVILDLLDAERLRPGDILVTTATSPPWTPLFAVAGAVVTDAGDEVSHVAIAAREYGIPCVVGAHHATALIPDGAVMVVDGDAGTIRVDLEP
jgi:pyruvate,water dikinase